MNSIFGTKTNDFSESRFVNLSVNLPQQQNVSKQQGNGLQAQNGQQSILGSQIQYKQNDSNTPSWFNNPRKRTIPQTIIKRISKPPSSDVPTPAQSSGNTSSGSNSGFGLITFGYKKSASLNSRVDTQGADMVISGNLIDSNEAPPQRSLYDLQREDEFGSVMPVANMDPSQKALSIEKDKDTTLMRNVFDRDVQETKEKKDKLNALSKINHNESAVLVFGYPEAISNQIIVYFSKFGNILEDFEVLRGVSGINTTRLRSIRTECQTQRKYPIFTGDGWIKLTYDSPSSALRALQESGTVYGGSLIGCVPYKKQTVEQLASCRIEKSDDIGGVNFSVNQTPNNNLSTQNPINDNRQLSQPHGDDQARFTFSTRKIDLKDGKSLFVHSGTANNHNFLKNLEDRVRQHETQAHVNGNFLNKISSWLFGWNDL